ncbi:MAG: YedE-related selenium metabolism membrane protein [Clostridia bacterium]|nr:YedE-related selenium metabolism membrane protein [Clostridia bacterium]
MEKQQSGFAGFVKRNWLVILTGLIVGAAAVVLTALGNPKNMGFCIACFERDIAGSLKFHSAEVVQYFRPEIVGLVLGAMIMSMIRKEWKPQGGSSPITRFVLGMLVMIGALVFLGCPLRMVIRIGGGDVNALIGLLGFIAGIVIGTFPLRFGFTLNRAYKQNKAEGLVFPILLAVLFVLSLLPELFSRSEQGPGSQHAPWIAALLIAIVVGALCQRSRLCMAGGVRDVVLFKDFHLIYGFLAIIVAVLVGNLITHNFKFGLADQPIAHTDGIFNFLGMALVGWGSVLLGGCPLRQLILAGEGNSDSAVTVFGFIAGAAVSHNFGLASSAKGIGAGPVLWVLIAGFVILAALSVFNTKRRV